METSKSMDGMAANNVSSGEKDHGSPVVEKVAGSQSSEGGGGGRKLVVLCDGTGNELFGDLSNVGKLYMSCVRDEKQIVYYDTGLGTSGDTKGQSFWRMNTTVGRIKVLSSKIFTLATGNGLRRKVLGAYGFLVENYQDGDEIYLIGSSRGAYTVRVVAAMIRVVGLLRPEQKNLCNSAFNSYMAELRTTDARGKKRSESDQKKVPGVEDYQSDFRRRTRSRAAPIRFVGLWDSVSAVLVLGNFACIPIISRLRTLPYTMENCIVQTWRHALAIDESRVFFIADRVHESEHGYCPIPWKGPVAPQDVKEVWFAGYHGDIGAGYAENESHLSKYPLIWLMRQAQEAGLRCHEYYIDRYAFGIPTQDQERQSKYGPDMDVEFVPPRTYPCTLHPSLTGGWHCVEYLPQRVKKERTNQHGCCCGACHCYFHRGERRVKYKQRTYCYETSRRKPPSAAHCCSCCCSCLPKKKHLSKDDDKNWVHDFIVHYSALRKHQDPQDPYRIVDLPPPDQLVVEGPETDYPPQSHGRAHLNGNPFPEQATSYYRDKRNFPPPPEDMPDAVSSLKFTSGLYDELTTDDEHEEDDDQDDDDQELSIEDLTSQAVAKNNPHTPKRGDVVSLRIVKPANEASS